MSDSELLGIQSYERKPSLVSGWIGITVVTTLIFLLFHGVASQLRSERGEWGFAVASIVVGACLVAERVLFGRPLQAAWDKLGFGTAPARAYVAVTIVSVAMIALLPAMFAVAGGTLTFHERWLLMLPGLFLQAGIAEETLFRGFLFGSFRERNPFWRAAFMSSGPFVLAHLPIFATMPWQVALASLLLALVTAFPLARLYELGNRTIWAAAILHTVIQGSVKVVVLDASTMTVPLLWMAACAVIPWAVFFFPLTARSLSER